MDLAASLPDLDSLDINQMGAPVPSSPAHAAGNRPAPVPQNSPWVIQPDEMAGFLRIFQHFDKDNTGKVSDEEMQKVIKQTKLDQKICAKVWDLTSPDADDFFQKPHFLMCMLLLSRAKTGVPLPSELPPELKASAGLLAPGQAPGSQPQASVPGALPSMAPLSIPQMSGPAAGSGSADSIVGQLSASVEALRSLAAQNNAVLGNLRMQNNTLEMRV